MALAQANVKRLLAYSSIAHVGYMLVGLAAGLGAGAPAVLFYLGVYAVASVGLRTVLLLLERGGEEAVDLAAYGGLATAPRPGAGLTVFLAPDRMPPAAGFVGKFYLFSAAHPAGLVWLAVIAVLNSVVAAYYYLRLIVYIHARARGSADRALVTPAASIASPCRPGPPSARALAGPGLDRRRSARCRSCGSGLGMSGHTPLNPAGLRPDQPLLERCEGRGHHLRLGPGGARRRGPAGRPGDVVAQTRRALETSGRPGGWRRHPRRRREGHGVPRERRRPAAGQ